MSTYSDFLIEDLIQAWCKLQEAHLDFEQAPEGAKPYKDH
jgi:hypothetical protein